MVKTIVRTIQIKQICYDKLKSEKKKTGVPMSIQIQNALEFYWNKDKGDKL